jgi:hypothetical protein
MIIKFPGVDSRGFLTSLLSMTRTYRLYLAPICPVWNCQLGASQKQTPTQAILKSAFQNAKYNKLGKLSM